MVYTKTIWKEEIGTNLNRFSKTNETPSSVELTRNPGEITQAGTPFSIVPLQNMEDGIEALDLQNLSITVTGNHTIGAYGTILVNAGIATITVPSFDLGIKKTIRKISATAGTITITLPSGNTFVGGGQSITLTKQWEEVTIERVSTTVWRLNSSNVGGVLNGAVIERGSNANGEFVKFADGTLICTKVIDIESLAITSLYGAIYTQATRIALGTTPNIFISRPTFNLTAYRTNDAPIDFQSARITSGGTENNFPEGWFVSPLAFTENVQIQATAIGRWK